MRLTLDGLVNGVVLVVCVVIGANATLQLTDRFRSPTAAARPANTGAPGPQSYQPGDVLPVLSDYSYSNADATLVVIVRSTCPYCTQSMPFYDRLIGAAKRSTGVIKVVGVSTEPTEVLKGYFESHGVAPELLRSVAEGYLRVPGTPTVVLVDPIGVVKHVWIGRLPAEDEAAVLSVVSSVSRRSNS